MSIKEKETVTLETTKMNENSSDNSMITKFPPVVDLNIGGHHFTTLLQTLTKELNSLLADMFSGKEPLIKDEHGRYFIDADGPLFAHILNYLRVGSMPPTDVAKDVCQLAEYFGIQSLVDKLQGKTTSTLSVKQEVLSTKTESRVRKSRFEPVAAKIQKTSSEFSSTPLQASATSAQASSTGAPFSATGAQSPTFSAQSPSSSDGEEKHSFFQEENKTNLIVNYLPHSMSDAAFSALFIPMGPIKTMKICRDKGGKSYGFGFVDFRNPEDAERAIQELNGRQIMNKKIKIAYVQKRDTGRKEARVCVKNLPDKYSSAELKELFSECGSIMHTGVRKYSDAKEFTGIVGFVVFENSESAEKAIKTMNGKVIPGCETGIVVIPAEENKPKRANVGPGIMGKAPSHLAAGRMMGNTPGGMMGNTPGGMMRNTPGGMMGNTPGGMMGNTPVQMMGNTPNQMMGNTPNQMMENRAGPMAPHGPPPMMRMGTNRPRMPNMGERMNMRPGMLGPGPRQMMGNRPMNDAVMGNMEGFVPDAMRNVQNRMPHPQNAPFTHNPGFGQNYNQYDMGTNRPDMPKQLASIGCVLYVDNLGQQCEQADLYQLFGPFGALIKVAVVKDKDSNRCKGYGFVTFMNSDEADAAILSLNGSNFDGRTIRVSYKK